MTCERESRNTSRTDRWNTSRAADYTKVCGSWSTLDALIIVFDVVLVALTADGRGKWTRSRRAPWSAKRLVVTGYNAAEIRISCRSARWFIRRQRADRYLPLVPACLDASNLCSTRHPRRVENASEDSCSRIPYKLPSHAFYANVSFFSLTCLFPRRSFSTFKRERDASR